MNIKQTTLIFLAIIMALLALTTYVLAGFGDMSSTNYSLQGGFIGAVGGQITSTNTLAEETRLEPFGNLGWADDLPGQWLPPESLPITGTHPALVFDSLGILHAAWLEDGGIGYAAMPEGGSWTTPTLVSDTANAVSADLAVSPEGNAHLTWIAGDAVYYSFKPVGGAWQNPATVIPTGSANAAASRIVLDAGGTVHLVWYDIVAGEFRYNHKPRGGEWRDNILHDGNPVPTDDIPDPGYANASAEFDLTIDAAGVLHLVWCDGEHCYHGQKDSYAWNATPTQLGTGMNLAAPAVALDEESNLYAVWSSQRITDTGGGITYCAFDGATCAMTQTWRAGYTTDAPAIAIDAAGQTHVVWHEGAPNGEIYYPQLAGVHQWLAPARLQLNLIGSHNPALIAGPSGVLHLVWQNTSAQHQGLYYMHTDPAPWQVTPDEVLAGAASSITITGRGFTTPTLVGVYSQTLTGTVVNSTTLAFTLPDSLPGGWHDLTLTRGDGASNVIPNGVWVTEPSTPLVLEENIPTPYKAAFGVTVDPDGNTWFIEADSGNTPEGGSSPTKLYRIPYGYQLKLEVPLSGRNPNALAADTLGYIWLSDPGANKIYQLDPVSDPGQFIITATFDIPTPDAGVQALAVNPYTNDIWFVEGNTGQLGWINRATGVITDAIYAYDVNDLLTDLAVDRDGHVWFTLANSSRIGRYEVESGFLREYKTPTDNAIPTGITVDPYGHIWFTENGKGKIARGIPSQMVQNTSFGITEYEVPNSNSCPYDIVADIGPDVGIGGRIWFTDKCANHIASWRADSFAPQTLFSDDFSAGIGNWITDTGTWTTTVGAFEGSGSGNNHVHGPALGWPNYRVQADVMLLSDGRAGVTVRESASDQHYRAEIGTNAAGHSYAYLGKVVAGSYITLAQANVDLVQGYTHTLHVDVNENVLRFSVDERLMVLVEDGALTDGDVGLHTTDATARFDNVHVERDVYSASGYFNAYPIPTEGSRPQDIAVRYDGGDVWFTERGTHKIGNLIRQADGSPARLQYTLFANGYWGDDSDESYFLPWQGYQQDVTTINPTTRTAELAGLIDPKELSTETVAAFTLDGITFRDNGPNDKDQEEDISAIIGMQSTVWHSLDTLYAVQQPIRVPIAAINLIDPSEPGYYVQSIPEDPVFGLGHGTSRNGNPIIAREWRSSRRATPLSTNSDGFGPLVLPEGTQILAYRVAVDDDKVAGQVWSPEATVRYRVNMRPIARFEMRGHGVQEDGSLYDVVEETLVLDGRDSYDPDGKIVEYKWTIDGNVVCEQPVCRLQNISANYLGVGTHEILLVVTDNDGSQSVNQLAKTLDIVRVPVIIMYGYGFLPESSPWETIEALAEYIENNASGYDYDNFVFPCLPIMNPFFPLVPIAGINIPLPPDDYGNVFVSNFSCSTSARDNLIDYAERLAYEVRMVRRWTGAENVDIVGYSTGGNVARWYTRFIDDDHVRRLIMLGTPNHGQHATNWLKGGYLGCLGPLGWLGGWLSGEAAEMQSPWSPFLTVLNNNRKTLIGDDGPDDELAPGVEHHVIYGSLPNRSAISKVASHGKWEFSSCVEWDWDLSCKKIKKWVIYYPEFQTGDGGILIFPGCWLPIMSPVDSVKLDNVPSYSEGLDHLALQEDEAAYETVLQVLLGNSRLRSQSLSVEPERISLPAHRTSSVMGDVAASEVFSYPVKIDATTRRVRIQIASIEPDLLVSFKTPDGRIIWPDLVEGRSATALYQGSQEEQIYQEYVLERPQTGQWYARVFNNSESDLATFSISALMETTVGLAVGTDSPVYTTTDPIHIFAMARDVMSGTSPVTLTDGILLARVVQPDGSVTALRLYDNGTHDDIVAGDGIFANIYTPTIQVGPYEISVAGQYAYNGETLLRRAGTRMEVQADVHLALATGAIGPRRLAEFGTTRSVLRANQTTDLIAYIHNDGQDAAHDILVHFYDGDPAQDSTFLGETRVDIPGEQTVAARLPWQVTQGVHDLHVIVDPYNFLMQRVEGGLEGALNARMATSVRMTAQDTTPPTADPGPSFTIPYSTSVRFDGLDSTDNVGVVTYTWEVDLTSIGRGTVELDGPIPVLVDGIGITGTYPVHLTVYDADGNSDKASTSLEVTEVPMLELPELTGYGGAQAGTFRNPRALSAMMQDSIVVNEDEDVQFSASADSGEFGLSAYNCEWTIDQDTAPNQNDLFGCRPVLEGGYRQPGIYHVELRVSDMWGNGPARRNITVTVNDTTAPVVDLPGVNEDYWHIDPHVTFTSTVTDNVGIASVWLNAQPVSVTAEGMFSATMALEEGTTGITVTAQDAAGNTTVVTRSVRYTAMDHFALAIADADIVAGDTFTATITAQYADDTTFPYTGTVRLDDTSGLLLPPQVAMVNGQWTGPLTLYAAQPVTITASACDRYGEQSVASVTPAPFDHVVIGPASINVAPGEAQYLIVRGYDAYNNVISATMTITWSVVNGGGTIDPATGWFTASDQPGTYTDTVQVQVTIDGQTEVGSASVVVERQTPQAPILLSPSDGTITTTRAITLAWRAGAGKPTLGYQVKLDGETITTTTTTSPTNLVLGTHTWTVRAYNDAGYSEWAAPWTVEVTPTLPRPTTPTLLSPTDGLITTDRAITLTWRAGTGAAPAGYRVALDGTVITTTATTSSTTLALGMHTWRVQAYNASGRSDWTPLWTFEITETVVAPVTPTLLSPPDGLITTTQTLAFQWQAGKGAAPTGYNVDLDGTVVTKTTTTWSRQLELGSHTWRVRAYNESGYSDWTAAWTVAVTESVPPSSPVLVAPPDNMVTTTHAITFAWQPGTGSTPDGYNVKVDDTVITTTATTSSTVLARGMHTWTVRAYNADGISAWAAPWTVTITSTTTTTPATPILVAPPDGTVTTTRAITFAWQAGDGPTSDGYNLDVNGDIIITTATMTSMSLARGVYTWTVQAYNTDGTSAWAEAWTLEITLPHIYLPLVVRNP